MGTTEASEPLEEDDTGYRQQLGERLRAIRHQQGLSLQEVEGQSNGEFKASVVGAYERGERGVSVPRLQRLAAVYNLPVDQLLPRPDGAAPAPMAPPTEHTGDNVTINLVALEQLVDTELEVIGRYLGMIQVQRQDFNGRRLSIRRDDLRALAAMVEDDVAGLWQRLTDLGLLSE